MSDFLPATPTEWKVARLSDVANFQNGHAFYKDGYSNEGLIAIDLYNVDEEGRLRFGERDKHVSPELCERFSKFKLNRNDLVMVMTDMTQRLGILGKCAVIDQDDRYILNQRLGRVTANESVVLTRYLYYFINSEYFLKPLRALAKGAVQKYVNTGDIKENSVLLPPLPAQRRIAGILSAYDKLMENCLRRMRILEEMARALYREWLVLFRFPDHEKVPRVDSPLGLIPKGWDVTTLGEQLRELESGKRPKGGIREVVDGVPSIGAENIDGIGSHDFTSDKFVPREFFELMNKGVVRDRDVAIYKDGAYIGKSSYFRDGFPHAECCVNEHVFLLRARGDRLTQNALYLWLREPDTLHAIRATNANAAQPGINRQSVCGLELIVPAVRPATQFDRLVEPMLASLVSNAKKIQNLRRTRDLLLPRLLSGQVSLDVSAVEDVALGMSSLR